MKRKIVSVIECKYDGYYAVRFKEGSKERTVCYEGINLCPQDVRCIVDSGNVSIYDGFHYNLI